MKIHNLVLAGSIALFVACNGGEESTSESEVSTQASEEAPVEESSSEQVGLTIPEGSHVFFENIESGMVVSSPLMVEMGVQGMEVQPAGELVDGTGHHHIVINKGHISKGEVVPADEHHIHYGGGQTTTELELEPGQYTLTLQFANGLHQSYGETMSATVEITVE